MSKRKGKLRTLLNRFELNGISLNSKVGNIDITYTNYDAEAAWILYVELLTRVTTQELDDECGDEISALKSVHEIFPVSRQILKQYGRKAQNFTKICIIVLNQIVRPFTSKWHPISIKDKGENETYCKQFRLELKELRINLMHYARLLADMANVEDITDINEVKIDD